MPSPGCAKQINAVQHKIAAFLPSVEIAPSPFTLNSKSALQLAKTGPTTVCVFLLATKITEIRTFGSVGGKT